MEIVLLLIIVALFILIVDVLMNKGISKINIYENSKDFDRILFVPGVMTLKIMVKRWKDDLNFYFPEKEIVFLDDNLYIYWQFEKNEQNN